MDTEATTELRASLIKSEENGELIKTLVEVGFGVSPTDCANLLSDLQNGNLVSLGSSTNVEAIQQLESNEFWQVQFMINNAIPNLQITIHEISALVQAMVDKGGNDMAAL